MRFVLAMSLMIMAATVFAAPSNPQSDRAALIRLAHEWLHAAQTHDRAALDRILADDFVDTSYRGTLRTKADVLAGAVVASPSVSQRLSDLKIRRFGDTAIMTGLNTVSGPHHTWTARVRFTDVYIERDGRWQAVSAQETVIKDAGRRKKK